jgi:hypothetical protein
MRVYGGSKAGVYRVPLESTHVQCLVFLRCSHAHSNAHRITKRRLDNLNFVVPCALISQIRSRLAHLIDKISHGKSTFLATKNRLAKEMCSCMLEPSVLG